MVKHSPFAIICFFFCLGIWTAKFLHIPLFFIYVACVLFLLSALLSGKDQLLFSLSLGLAVFLTGFIHLVNAQRYPANHLANFISDEPQAVYLLGRIVTHPEVSDTSYGAQETVFTFRIEDVKVKDKWQTAEGLIRVSLYGERRDKDGEIGDKDGEVGDKDGEIGDKDGQRRIEYGDELLLGGLLSRPPGLRNPGGFDYRQYLANYNIFGLLRVKEQDVFLSWRGNVPFQSLRANKVKAEAASEAKQEVISKEGIASPRPSVGARNDKFIRALFRFKQKLHKIIYQHLDSEQAALLSAILLGERANLSEDIKDLFINTGTVHILAISGLHVGLIALILLTVLRFLRLPQRLTFILTIFLLLSYAFLSGARPSVIRATIMAVIVLLGLLMYRETHIYNSLGLAALLILLVHPQYLFDSGFQLSFLSVFSLVYFAPKIEKIFPSFKGFLGYLIRALSVSLAAWIGIAPLIAFYFNLVSPIAVLANLVVIPWLFLVVTIGISFLVFAFIWPPLGAVFSQSSGLSLIGLNKLALFFSKLPLGFFHCPRPSVLFFLVYYSLLLLIFNYQRLRLSLGKVGIGLALLANALVWKPLCIVPLEKLTVTFLDVGLGDAIFVEFPYSGGTMLIDGGPAVAENDSARRVILPCLWNKGIDKIDAVLLTHPDDDHMGGLASVLKKIKVNYLFDSGMPKKSLSYDAYRREAQKRPIHYQTVKQGEEISGFGQVRLFVLHPPQPLLTGQKNAINNNSVVLKLVYDEVSFLFCGDIQTEAMEQLLTSGPILKSTIIKVPHHGSNEGKAQEHLFKTVSPQVAVISVNRSNRFKFPAKETLERLEKLGTKVYTTRDRGAVIVSTDGRKIWLKMMVGSFPLTKE